jgi:hypothetical protein
MKTQHLIALLFALTMGPSISNAQLHGSQFEGCISPEKMTPALEKLRDSKWKEVNMARVQAIWPRELYPDDCKGNVCTPALRSKILNNEISNNEYDYCGETFHFKVKPDAGGEELGTFSVVYLALSKKEIIDAARGMTKAFGVPQSELAIQGKHLKQDYYYDNSSDNHTWVRVNIRHEKQAWTATLLFSRYQDTVPDRRNRREQGPLGP